jgi:transposase InsO family protein
MGLSRSSYYYQAKGEPEAKRKEDADIRDRLEALALRFPRYGYRRMTAQLKREGFPVNHKRVLRIMREAGLLVKTRKRYVPTTDSQHSYAVYPNLYKDAQIQGIDAVWVADITYIRILLGFVYLAVILDAFSRKVIGYAISKSLDTRLTVSALESALRARQPNRGCIHHSDRGVQYACENYVELLKTHGLRISMSAKGNPYENAQVESFFKTLKTEEVYLMDYRDWDDVVRHLPVFIEDVYNRERLHSALGYMSPDEFEQTLDRPKQMAAG